MKTVIKEYIIYKQSKDQYSTADKQTILKGMLKKINNLKREKLISFFL